MTASMLLLASANAAICVVAAYLLTRRYSWRMAFGLPLAALAAFIAIQWQNEGATLREGLRLTGQTLVFAAPMLVGSGLGILLARRES